jgi:signal transduction histidine kinase
MGLTNLTSRVLGLVEKLLGSGYLVLASSLLFSAVIAVAFCMVYVNSRAMHNQINDSFNQQQLILARQCASRIDAALGDLQIEVKSLKALQPHARKSVFEQTKRAALERTRDKGLIEIGVIDPSGRSTRVCRDGSRPEARPEEGKGMYPPDPSGHIYLSPLRVETGENVRVTSVFYTPMTCINGQGALYARVDVSRLVAGATSEIRSGRTGYAWVIDQSGMFLYHPEAAFIGKNAFFARAQRQPYISFAKINRIMKERMLRGEEGVGVYESGWHRGVEGRMTKLIAFTPVKSQALVPGSLWSVGVAAPISEVSETVHWVYIRHFIAEAALIIAVFMVGILAFVQQRRISTDLKARVARTESDLQVTERIYQRVVEQATDLIYIVDPGMRVVLLNPHSIEVFSHLVVAGRVGTESHKDTDLSRPEYYIGRDLHDLLRPEDVAFMRTQMDRVVELQSSISFAQTVTIDGRQVHLSTKLIPIRNEKEEIYQFLSISRDVTERMEMDQRIYHTEKLASIGTLAAGVAHEINNPLAVILGFADLLLERFPSGSQHYEDLKIIEYNANNARKVVQDLLGFARSSEGPEETVDIDHSVETVLRIVRNSLMTKKIALVAEIPGNLPRVRGDTREFQQVIFNLINNSMAAMGKAGDTLTVVARAEGEWVHVDVIDTGTGIPDRIKPRIFDPFFTTKKVGEGTGLGLSLCYGIVKKYGGKITFSSSTGQENLPARPGTHFTVSMPVQRTS